MINGLSTDEVIKSRQKFGNNSICLINNNTFGKLFIETLGDPIIKILLIALAIKTIFLFQNFDWFETIGIVLAILIASFISSISEYGSETAFKKLQDEATKIKCKVKRDNKIRSITIDEIVVKDVVLLQTGDKIPADGIVIDGIITVDESSLNGETKEIYKSSINDNQLYRGTTVYDGNALMLVNKVGNNTLYGQMALELQTKTPDSPLKIKLNTLAKIISRIGYVSAIIVSLSYLFKMIIIANDFEVNKILTTINNLPLLFSYILYALTLSVTIIVVTVPEGLPMMITLVLSSNMKKMLKKNVLVRKMIGIETAGSLNILFTDKTGTLTRGKLQVINFINSNNQSFNNEQDLAIYKHMYNHVKNNCIYNNDSYSNEQNEVIGGNITDQAILNFITSERKLVHPKIKTISFNSLNKYSVTTIKTDRLISYIKGAPEILLPLCKNAIDNYGKKIILNKKKVQDNLDQITKQGIRVILLGFNDSYNQDSMNNFTLVGFLCIKDEIRKEAFSGLNQIKQAGIKTVMITGDNKYTATNIAQELHIIDSKDDLIITSDELNKMNDEKIKNIFPHLKVVARSLPQDKNRLIKIARNLGLVVGMTGDGVNDALALKHSDVGFAMGSGTEVAKEASDIVILDNNIASIATAILYGRTIFKNIRKFIIFQLTINLCAISLSIIGPFIGITSPVTVIQMLWINMIMDTLAGLAFAYEPPNKEYMQEPPKQKSDPIINSYMYGEIIFTGIFSAGLCIFFLKSPTITSLFRYHDINLYQMTAFFALLIFMSIFNCFNARTHHINLLKNINQNKTFIFIISIIVIIQLYLIYYGGQLFRTHGLTIKELIITITLASIVIPIDFIRKIYLNKNHKNTGV